MQEQQMEAEKQNLIQLLYAERQRTEDLRSENMKLRDDIICLQREMNNLRRGTPGPHSTPRTSYPVYHREEQALDTRYMPPPGYGNPQTYSQYEPASPLMNAPSPPKQQYGSHIYGGRTYASKVPWHGNDTRERVFPQGHAPPGHAPPGHAPQAPVGDMRQISYAAAPRFAGIGSLLPAIRETGNDQFFNAGNS
mmetsp:Transcript_12929/g.26408  ORF Transcript_12929/g.26408 Transcript_12929/m.26408 type:complete len:194 (+) Transcript_12929:1002-1583(+)